MRQLLSLVALLFYCVSLWGQQDSSYLFTKVDAETFFRNNEYLSPYGTGYTLPGYKINGLIGYQMGKKFRHAELSLGLHIAGYYGAQQYPHGTWFAELPHWTDKSTSTRIPHLIPLVGLSFVPTPNLTLRIGLIDYQNGHQLIEPMYNPELLRTADPEQGVQLRADYPFFRGDVWINWQSFIFRADNHQEAFTAGLTTEIPIFSKGNYSLEGLLQATATHRGGEINWMRSDTVHTYSAAALGLKQQYALSSQAAHRKLSWEAYLLLSSMRTAEKNNPIGKGLFARASFHGRHLFGAIQYWRGSSFVAPMGGPFTNTRALWEGPYTHDAPTSSHVGLQGKYTFSIGKQLELAFQANGWYHLMPTPLPSNGRISHSLELYLRLSPEWRW